MDDYITKPFEVQELVAALRKCQPRVGQGYAPADTEVGRGYAPAEADAGVGRGYAPANATKHQTPILSILDPAALKRLRVNLGKRATAMLPVLIENFFDNATQLQEDARQAFERRQTKDLCRAVHTLKSNSKTFGATEFAKLCQELENSAKTGEFEHAEELFMQITTEYLKVKAALESLQQSL
jgi:HPt (histidine-containing phosphotransfer) domain-containing protein